jgi:taurine dioxygenase
MLCALEIPPTGGDTSFCDMYAALETLPPALRDRSRVKHDGTYNSGGYVRQGVTPADDPRQAPGISFTRRWRVGDLVLWVNRCTMHRRDPFDASTLRIMHRTRVKGSAPPAA